MPESNRDRMQRRSRTEPWLQWYKTARWQRLRLATFQRNGFRCQWPGCNRLADTPQLVCDHIEAHRGNEQLFWRETNLQTLCKSCHSTHKQRDEQATLHQRGVWY